MTTIRSYEAVPGAAVREVVTAGTAEKFIVISGPAPVLVVGYRVRNTGANSCSVRVLRSLTASVFSDDPSQAAEWTELVEPTTVATAESTADDLETIATAIAVGVTSSSGTTAVVEILVAK